MISESLFKSNPAVSKLQCRLTEENGVTRMSLVHERGVDEGLTQLIGRIRTAAAERAGR